MSNEPAMQPAATRPVSQELTPLIYDELRRIAQAYFRNLRPGFTLCPTELVNEACLHLLQHARGDWVSPEHFRAIATRKIWQVIVDHLKRRTAAKRGGVGKQTGQTTAATAESEATSATTMDAGAQTPWHRMPLESLQVEWQAAPIDLLDLAEALDDLSQQSARLHEVVMLHWFGGMKYTDVGAVLGISGSSAEKDFRFALAWLSRRLAGGGDAR